MFWPQVWGIHTEVQAKIPRVPCFSPFCKGLSTNQLLDCSIDHGVRDASQYPAHILNSASENSDYRAAICLLEGLREVGSSRDMELYYLMLSNTRLPSCFVWTVQLSENDVNSDLKGIYSDSKPSVMRESTVPQSCSLHFIHIAYRFFNK